jgi:hypothetical protein
MVLLYQENSSIWITSFEIEYVEKARKAVDGKKDVELRPIQVCGVNRKSFNP